MHTVENGIEAPSPKVCENPLRDVEFPESSLKIEPKRFCSPDCRQQASLIRRVAALLDSVPDATVSELDCYALRRARTLLNKVGVIEFHHLLDHLQMTGDYGLI